MVAGACQLFEEFAAQLDLPLAPVAGRILLHGHCHQKSMGLLPATRALLSRIPSATVVDLDAGCCGMAGSFGYHKQHFEISHQIASRRLLPAARSMTGNDILVAPGISCRHQIRDFSEARGVHPAVLIRSLLNMAYRPGRHFLQIPGPTNVPDRVLRAIDHATIDHRSAEFGELGIECLLGLQAIFQTQSPVILFPGSATGAWEAALVNTLNAGDRVLAYETRPFFHSLDKSGAQPGTVRGPGSRRLASWRGCGSQWRKLAERPESRDQSGYGGPQRDIHGRDIERCGGTPCDGRSEASGAADGRYRLFARIDRLSA